MKLIKIFLALNIVASTATLMVYAYRYMWFSTETIPEGRITTAFAVMFIALTFYGIIHEASRN